MNEMNILSVDARGNNEDGYNIIICDGKTHEPLYAIEYGSAL